MIVVNLTSESKLFLTEQEATNLAKILQDQLQADSEIVIADTLLTAAEAARVIRSIKDALDVDWKVEGF
jgi:hypothetical protein